MAVSATLVRNAFGNTKGGWVNLQLDNTTGISAPNPGITNGTVLTITTGGGDTIVAATSEVLNNNSVRARITAMPPRRNHCILRTGWTVTG